MLYVCHLINCLYISVQWVFISLHVAGGRAEHGEVEPHTRVVEPGLKPRPIPQPVVPPATQFLRPESAFPLIPFFPSPSHPLSHQVP